MVIQANTRMLLIRYCNYKKLSFIDEHRKVLSKEGFVWMMRLGKTINPQKIQDVLDDGGHLILKAPKKDGDQYYICRFTSISDKLPEGGLYSPKYYVELIREEQFVDSSFQFFRVISITPIPKEELDKLTLQLNGKKVNTVVKETRTSFMYVQNDKVMTFEEGM